MAITAKYTEQMPFVGTGRQKECIETEAARRGVSMAQVIRWAIDERYKLEEEIEE